MTVDRDTGIAESFVGSGTTGPFAVTNFNIATVDQIEPGGVKKTPASGNHSTLILNDPGANGYTAVISNGLVTINTVASVAAGWTLTVERSTAALQPVALPEVGRFLPHDVEKALDLLAMRMQEVRGEPLGSAEATNTMNALIVGWDDSPRLWTEIEVSIELSVNATGIPALRASLTNGGSSVATGYNWVAAHSYGGAGPSTMDGYVGDTVGERQQWQISGNLAPNNNSDARLIGNFRISRLDIGKSTKIVGACTFNTVAGFFAHVSMGGTLDDQISTINSIVLTDFVIPNNIAAGSRIDVRGIR